MSDTLPNDGLLKAGRLLTSFLMILLGLVAAVLVVVIPFILFSQSHVADAMVQGATASLPLAQAAIIAVLVVGIILLLLGFHFLQLLKRIINSVGEGDPFIPVNAERLTRMGWVIVAIEVLKLPVIAIAHFLATQFKPEDVQVDLEFSLTGLLFGLVLFILARVFRHGAAMRDDLTGTV